MPRFDVQPGDLQVCRGCGQQLQFDANGFVPEAALRACQSACDWVLVERRQRPDKGRKAQNLEAGTL